MEERRVDCINKNDRESPYERISHIGGIRNGQRWKEPSGAVIMYIELEMRSYYVEENGVRTQIVVAERNGNKYLRTEADDDEPNNLLSLPDCQ